LLRQYWALQHSSRRGLYEACRDHTPVLALSGQMPRQLQGLDYFQATDRDLSFGDVLLYTETVSSPAQAPAIIHQAIATAYAVPIVPMPPIQRGSL
jgi:pyruvate dehydrogenase (quinone)